MHTRNILYLISIPLLAFLSACMGKAHSNESFVPEKVAYGDNFKDYWYQGKAEISSYRLEQARYGEIHEGTAVMIFVTEDFSQKKQVKLDNPGSAGNDRVPIMKLNFSKKFNTGIYPYSMMQSVFTPVDTRKFPHTLKTTMSSQEWCGHTFTQLNLDGDHYQLKGFSYFESEGDESNQIKGEFLEDELLNLIRINPKKLPVGEVSLIPGSFFSRLSHRPIKPEKAQITLSDQGDKQTYSIKYPAANRSLAIQFEKEFPHKILGWEETYQDGARVLTTRGTMMETLFTDYWNRHSNADLKLRDELGL